MDEQRSVQRITIPNRRRAIVWVSPDILIALCKMTEPVTVRVSANPLPEDARLVGTDYDVQRDAWRLVVESQTFPETGEGYLYPELPAVEWSRTDALAQPPTDAVR